MLYRRVKTDAERHVLQQDVCTVFKNGRDIGVCHSALQNVYIYIARPSKGMMTITSNSSSSVGANMAE